jgi:uncharacterized membrane protein YkvA (DUF1232 family)
MPQHDLTESAEHPDEKALPALRDLDLPDAPVSGEFIRLGAQSMSQEDVARALAKRARIEAKFNRPGPLRTFLAEAETMLQMLADTLCLRYGTPWHALAAVAFALLYVAAPLDLLADFIPGLGLVDDAAVVSLCLGLVREDIARYRAWRISE